MNDWEKLSAQAQLAIGPARGLERMGRVRAICVDSPWHGYGGPADRGAGGFFLAFARPLMPDGLEDMRARSAMFQGDPKSKDAVARAGLLGTILPANASVELVFAEQGEQVMDYTEGLLRDLAPKLVDHFALDRPVQGDPRLVNVWKAVVDSTAYFPFQDELRALADARKLDVAGVQGALARRFPRFPGDHMGVLREHPGQRSFLDHLADELGLGAGARQPGP